MFTPKPASSWRTFFARIIFGLFLLTSIVSVNAQTKLELHPGQSLQIIRTPLINFTPVTSVKLAVSGENAEDVTVTLNSWKTIYGSLNIETKYTIKVKESVLTGLIRIRVLLTYDAAGVLNRTLYEDFEIDTGIALQANFIADATSGTAPLVVNFTDQSSGNITSRLWDFGDGSTSTVNNPQHIFTKPGTYTIKLRIMNTTGFVEKERMNYITVTAAQVIIKLYLRDGWNLVSWNVDTAIDSSEVLLREIRSKIIVALGYESGGQTYDPQLPHLSTLPIMDHLHGYWIKMRSADTLRLSGASVDYTTTAIPCEQGWNLVSYLPNKSDSVSHCFSSIMKDNLVAALAYNGGGITYSPTLPSFSSLQVARPFLGYWIKLKQAADLIYPQPLIEGNLNQELWQPTAVSESGLLQKQNEVQIPTIEWMNVYGERLYYQGALLAPGTVVTARNGEGNICGSFTVREPGNMGFMPVYRDDPSTQEKEGPQAGEIFQVYIDDKKISGDFIWSGLGEMVKLTGVLTSVEQDRGSKPAACVLWQNYPNPFNPQTTISFQLDKPGMVKLSVRNLLGQDIAVLMDAFTSAGLHKTYWDGCDKNGVRVPSGLYLYTVTTGDFSHSRKMLLVY